MNEISWFGLFLSMVQIPILMFVFLFSIRYLRKKKASALLNKVISVVLLGIADLAYLAVIMIFIMKFGFQMGSDSDYRTIDWQVAASSRHEFKIYNDYIPLTCEDLYGNLDYDYYSYHKEVNHTFFLTKSNYRQDTLPAKNTPPQINYTIIEPQYDFVYRIAKEQLLEIPQWRTNMRFELVDNKIFGTVEAYQEYYDGEPGGNYILLFEDKIIEINLEKQPTTKQMAVIKEKLKL